MRRILFGVVLLFVFNISFGQSPLPAIRSAKEQITLRVDNNLYVNEWRINPALKPDVQTIPVHGKPVLVAFLTGVDSIGFMVEGGKDYDFFIVLNGKDSAWTRVRGEKYVNPATFNAAYIKAHNGKNFVEIPEVYELINVLFAITPTGKKNSDIAYSGTPYYKEVINYFERFSDHPTVKIVDSLLQADQYHKVKMDAYSLEFDGKGKLRNSAVYDRVSWGTQNTLRPYVAALQSFADASKFRQFYKAHLPVYNAQIRYYRDSSGIDNMSAWLNNNFPDTRYNSFKIIFSPLVNGNQSANWFENNSFREAQAHVNFPYMGGNWLKGLSVKAANLKRSDIVFTELNHAFINPESEKTLYDTLMGSAFNNMEKWAKKGSTAGNSYNNKYACLQEYLNWVLVSLRYVDQAPAADVPLLLEQNNAYMLRRGFIQFPAFSEYVVSLYRQRPAGATLASLYPPIFAWCIEHDR